MKKEENLFVECERVSALAKVKGLNWNADMSASVIVNAVLQDAADALAKNGRSSADVEALLTEDWGKEARKASVAMIKPLMTAPKNFSNTWLVKHGLMDKVVTEGKGEEFV